MSAVGHALAILLLPGLVAVAVPVALVWSTRSVSVGWGLREGLAVVPVGLGIALLALGAILVVWTIALFVDVGRGTIALLGSDQSAGRPRAYRHVRNPIERTCLPGSPG